MAFFRRAPIGHWAALLLMPCLLLSQAAARGHQFEPCHHHEDEARPHLHWNLTEQDCCGHDDDDAANLVTAASPADHHDDAVYLSADTFSFDRTSYSIEDETGFTGLTPPVMGVSVQVTDAVMKSFESTMLTAARQHCARYLTFQRILI